MTHRLHPYLHLHPRFSFTSLFVVAVCLTACPPNGDTTTNVTASATTGTASLGMSETGEHPTSTSTLTSSTTAQTGSTGDETTSSTSSTGSTDMTNNTFLTDGECDLTPGKALAPCINDETCDPGLVCSQTLSGTQCQPPCGPCEDGTLWPCIAMEEVAFGFDCNGNPPVMTCELGCSKHEDCLGGTVCALVEHICVWPLKSCLEPGKPFGPCGPDNTCSPELLCINFEGGTSACLPACATGGACDNECSKGLGNGTGTTMCLVTGVCAVPCTSDLDCQAGVCDKIAKVCAYESA